MVMIYTLTLNPALDKEYRVTTLVLDEVVRSKQARIDFGGKGFNVSRMLRRLGVDCIALGFVGGYTGDILSQGLESLGIRTELTRIDGETRTNVSIVGEKDSHYLKINEEGPSVSQDEMNTLLRKIDTITRQGDFWVLAGSVPNKVPDDIYFKIIQKVNQAGAFAILDSSGLPLKLGIKAKPFLIKPNVDELSQLIGREILDIIDLSDVAQELHSQGIQNILVSMGEKGALLSALSHQFVGRSSAISVMNPIGAGDAMIAGYIWRLIEGDSTEAALHWSIACGTAATSLPGTETPSLERVRACYQKISVKAL